MYLKNMKDTTGEWNLQWKAFCDVGSAHSHNHMPLTSERSLPKTSRKTGANLSERSFGITPMESPQSASLTTNNAKRFDGPWKAARPRRTFAPLSSSTGRGPRSTVRLFTVPAATELTQRAQTLRNISTMPKASRRHRSSK